MSVYIGEDEAIKNLANAVIIQACKDYVDGYRPLDCLLFFQSQYFDLLSRGTVNRTALLNHLEKEQKKWRDPEADKA